MTLDALSKPVQQYDVRKVREDFPILKQKVHGKPLVYLDNAASSQKPQVVIDAVSRAYSEYYSNVHRGVHHLSELSTDAYEGVRMKVKDLLHAKESREIIYTRGTTEAVNLVAHSFVRPRLKAGDEILITGLEHHSNIVPWQILCEQTGAHLKIVPLTDIGEVRVKDVEECLTEKTRFLSIAHMSNALGTVVPVKEICALAHRHDIPVMVDGAQSVPRMPVDVVSLGCDFYAFSSHKLYGPTGVGVLYGKAEHLEAMTPYQAGGDMILSVSFEKTEYNAIPHKFEAGTPNIVGAIGLGAAIDYIQELGLLTIAQHESELLNYATQKMRDIEGLTIIGTAPLRTGLISFVMEGLHPHDIGTILDHQGVAIRAGHHCAEPVMTRYGVPGTARASFGVYNTKDEIDVLVQGLHKVKEVFGP